MEEQFKRPFTMVQPEGLSALAEMKCIRCGYYGKRDEVHCFCDCICHKEKSETRIELVKQIISGEISEYDAHVRREQIESL